MTIAAAVLLGLAVLSIWLACFGFLRFQSALDRLHCSAFVSAAAGSVVTAAVFIQDGASDRSLKMAGVLAILLVGGAATMHAVGRALLLRSGARR